MLQLPAAFIRPLSIRLEHHALLGLELSRSTTRHGEPRQAPRLDVFCSQILGIHAQRRTICIKVFPRVNDTTKPCQTHCNLALQPVPA
jgi:hypothetical protein